MKKVLLLAALAAAQPINHLSAGFLKSLIEDSPAGPRAIMIDYLDRARQTNPDTNELISSLNLHAATDGLEYTPLWHQVQIYQPALRLEKLNSFFIFYSRAVRSIRPNKTPEMLTDDLLISWMKDCPEFKNTFVATIKLLITKQKENQISILPFLDEFFGSPYTSLLTEEEMQDLMNQMFSPTGNTELDEETVQLEQAVQAGIQRGLQGADQHKASINRRFQA